MVIDLWILKQAQDNNFYFLVLVKFKPEITQAAIDQTIKDVVALKESIPQIITASAGKNFTDRGKGYEYGKLN